MKPNARLWRPPCSSTFILKDQKRELALHCLILYCSSLLFLNYSFFFKYFLSFFPLKRTVLLIPFQMLPVSSPPLVICIVVVSNEGRSSACICSFWRTVQLSSFQSWCSSPSDLHRLVFDKWPRGFLLQAPQAAPPRSDIGKMRRVLGYSCQSFRWRLSCGRLTSVLLWFGNKGMPLLWHLLMEKVTAQLRILNGHSLESILLHPTNTGRQLVTSTIQDRRQHGKCSYST